MNLAILLSVGSAAMELVVGLLLWLFGRSPAYRSLRWFALCALGAVGLSTTNIAFPSPSCPPAWILIAGQLGGFSAAVASASWLAYTRVRRGLPALGGADRVVVVGLGLGGLTALVPGAVYRYPVVEVPVPVFDLSYRIPETTALGGFFLGMVLLGLGASIRHLLHAGAGWGRGLHLGAVGVLLLTATNDVLVTLGLVSSPYLVDLSFVLLCLAVSLETAQTMGETSLRLERHSALLREQVEARTAELIDAREALDRSERLAGLGRLAAGVGHEINNPLASVTSNVEFALEELPTDDTDTREALDDALAGARRIAAVVSQLNVLTRRAPRLDAVTEVRSLLGRALAAVEPELSVGTTVVWEVEGAPWVAGDPDQLELVAIKLLTNAAQAIASPKRPRRLTLGAKDAPKGQVALSIADTGEGIAPEHIPLLFEPFHSTKLGQGIGLGLTICHSIVESLGGWFEVDSEVGRGTTIRVFLPRAAPPTVEPAVHDDEPDESAASADGPQSMAEPAAPEDVRSGGATEPPRGGPAASSRPPRSGRVGCVLIVDDEAPVARSLARLLATHRVEVMSDSAAALDVLLARGEEYDLVLCDLTMPSPTGAELHAALEQKAPEVARRFVFVTGGSIDEPSRALLLRDGIRYLVKPVDSRELRRLVDESVGVGRTNRSD